MYVFMTFRSEASIGGGGGTYRFAPSPNNFDNLKN